MPFLWDRYAIATVIKWIRGHQNLRKFINDLPYKSDEMAHVVFPDERYNKQKHADLQRWSLRRSKCKWEVSVELTLLWK